MVRAKISRKTGFAIVIGVLILISLWAVGMVFDRRQVVNQVAGFQWRIIRPPEEVTVLVEQEEIIWAGGIEGVYKLDRIQKVYVEEVGDFTHVKGLIIDTEGRLWIGHEKGITIYDGSFTAEYTVANGLPDNHVTALTKDLQGRIWVGTWKGAAVFDGSSWRVINSNNGLIDDMVNTIYVDSFGGIWFGSYTAPRGGLSYFNGKAWQYLWTENGMPHNNINSIVQLDDGSMLIGTGYLDRGGAVTLTKNEQGIWQIQQIITKDSGLPGEKVRSVFQDESGIIWYGTEYDGLACMRDRSWRVFKKENGLSGNEIKMIMEDTNHNLWLGTDNGITFIDRANITL
jgi:ligand-binding sensor domain-containing protein